MAFRGERVKTRARACSRAETAKGLDRLAQTGVAFQAGDIAVLPRGDAHELSNGRVTELIDSSELLPKLFEGAVVSERGGGGGRITKFICGYVGCDRQAERSFLAGLPLFIETLRRYMVELPRRRTGWLAAARDSAVGRALGPRDARGSG